MANLADRSVGLARHGRGALAPSAAHRIGTRPLGQDHHEERGLAKAGDLEGRATGTLCRGHLIGSHERDRRAAESPADRARTEGTGAERRCYPDVEFGTRHLDVVPQRRVVRALGQVDLRSKSATRARTRPHSVTTCHARLGISSSSSPSFPRAFSRRMPGEGRLVAGINQVTSHRPIAFALDRCWSAW